MSKLKSKTKINSKDSCTQEMDAQMTKYNADVKLKKTVYPSLSTIQGNLYNNMLLILLFKFMLF